MSNFVHATADLITLRVSLARIAQAMFSGETSNSTPFDGLPDVLGKGTSELYVLARNEDRGWNSLAMLVIHEIQHSQLMLEMERKEKIETAYENERLRARLLEARRVLDI